MSEPLHQLTLHEAAELLRRREISSLELTRATFQRIDETEEQIHAFLTLTEDLATEQARRADERIARGQGGPLTGIPGAMKDVLCTAGVRTTCGSRILEPFIPDRKSVV